MEAVPRAASWKGTGHASPSPSSHPGPPRPVSGSLRSLRPPRGFTPSREDGHSERRFPPRCALGAYRGCLGQRGAWDRSLGRFLQPVSRMATDPNTKRGLALDPWESTRHPSVADPEHRLGTWARSPALGTGTSAARAGATKAAPTTGLQFHPLESAIRDRTGRGGGTSRAAAPDRPWQLSRRAASQKSRSAARASRSIFCARKIRNISSASVLTSVVRLLLQEKHGQVQAHQRVIERQLAGAEHPACLLKGRLRLSRLAQARQRLFLPTIGHASGPAPHSVARPVPVPREALLWLPRISPVGRDPTTILKRMPKAIRGSFRGSIKGAASVRATVEPSGSPRIW